MLLFLDSEDTLYTPEKFFFQTLQLHYWGSPGPLYASLLKAFWGFLYILLFLMFVFVVVMAFGDSYKVTPTNQLMVTVAAGFLPFLFGKVLVRPKTEYELETDSVQFQVELQKVIRGFKQTWPVSDIGGAKPGTEKKPAPRTQGDSGVCFPPWCACASEAAATGGDTEERDNVADNSTASSKVAGAETEEQEEQQKEVAEELGEEKDGNDEGRKKDQDEEVTITPVDITERNGNVENVLTMVIDLKNFVTHQKKEKENTRDVGTAEAQGRLIPGE